MASLRYARHLTGERLLDEMEAEGVTCRELYERYKEEIPTYDTFRNRVKREELRRERLTGEQVYGSYRSGLGCDEGCPHYERCAWLVRQWIPAEHIAIGCMVKVRDLAAWAAGVDAAPEFRAWQATRQIRECVAELSDGAGEAT